MVLDTTFCVDLLREQSNKIEGKAFLKLKSLSNIQIYIPIFVLCELQAGARMSKNPANELKKVEMFASLIEIIYPEKQFANLYGESEVFLRKNGTPIPVMDLLIGTAAKQIGKTLLTKDIDHFKLIPDLIIDSY